jgi:hypothetical protein
MHRNAAHVCAVGPFAFWAGGWITACSASAEADGPDFVRVATNSDAVLQESTSLVTKKPFITDQLFFARLR